MSDASVPGPARRAESGSEGERDAERQHVEVLAAEVATRLRAVCAHLSDAEFDALCRQIAETKLRLRRIDDDDRYWHPAVTYAPPVAPLPPRRVPREGDPT